MSSKSQLVLLFEQGDVPVGANFADLINSCVNMNETTTQTILGPLNPTELVTARVSAGNGKFTSGLEVQSNVSATRIFCSTSVHTSALDMRGGNVTNAGKVTTSAAYFGNGIVSAAGSTQATAALLVYTVNIGAGLSDGVDTGFILPANQAGRIQYIQNANASANLWPCADGQINALSSNAAFGMAANTLYTVIHTRASGYAVK